MTQQKATEERDLGELVLALAGFMRSTVPNRVGGTTVHLIADRGAWDRMLDAAAKVVGQ